MPHRDSPAICRKVDAALDYFGDDEEQLRPYLLYQLEHIMTGQRHIYMDDCKTSELVTLLAVLLPVFARSLAGIPTTPLEDRSGKLLTLITGGAAVDATGT